MKVRIISTSQKQTSRYYYKNASEIHRFQSERNTL